jgi:N,N'-diacetyllegionaminate synthase
MNFPRAFLIAEIGINHNGNMALAAEMIRAAADAGADAVKFQNYRTEDFLSDRTLTYAYNSQGREITEPQFDLFKRCELSRADLFRLKKCCDSAGVEFFSTPTGSDGIKDLQEMGAVWLKNGSDYLGHLPLIQEMARSGIPTILSTGMAMEEEITEAVAAFREAGGRDLVLLACTSAYPTPPDNLHLRRITTLAQKYACPAGFSDHSAGWEAAVAAVCVGACMVEKHFTTDRHLPGPDQWFSSTPQEFAELVRRVREAEEMLGCGDLRPTRAEAQAREDFRLSCAAACDLPAGALIKKEDISFRRPANGFSPSKADFLIGKMLSVSIRKGETIQISQIQDKV